MPLCLSMLGDDGQLQEVDDACRFRPCGLGKEMDRGSRREQECMAEKQMQGREGVDGKEVIKENKIAACDPRQTFKRRDGWRLVTLC